MKSLPSAAQLKLFNLQALANDVAAMASQTSKRIAHLTEALELEQGYDDRANLEHEISRLRAVLTQQQSKSITRAQLVAQVTTFADAMQPHWSIEVVNTQAPALKGGETRWLAVQALRTRIGVLSVEHRRAMLSLMEKSEQRKRAEQFVRSLANSIDATISAYHQTGFKVSVALAATVEERPAALRMAAWMDPEALTRKLHAMIDAAPDNRTTMTFTDREKRMNELAKQLMQAERHEEAHIVAAAADDGLEIERRPQADPCALLCLCVTKRAVVQVR